MHDASLQPGIVVASWRVPNSPQTVPLLDMLAQPPPYRRPVRITPTGRGGGGGGVLSRGFIWETTISKQLYPRLPQFNNVLSHMTLMTLSVLIQYTVLIITTRMTYDHPHHINSACGLISISLRLTSFIEQLHEWCHYHHRPSDH